MLDQEAILIGIAVITSGIVGIVVGSVYAKLQRNLWTAVRTSVIVSAMLLGIAYSVLQYISSQTEGTALISVAIQTVFGLLIGLSLLISIVAIPAAMTTLCSYSFITTQREQAGTLSEQP